MDPIVELSGVAIAYGDAPPVLRDVDFAIERGAFVAIVGASGVGKSTLLRVLLGLAQPAAGTAVVRAQPSPDRLPLAPVFQDARLFPWRRVLANVAYGMEGLKISAAERRARAQKALALVGLEAFAERWPRRLSGGQRQRVALARALAVRPDLLLLDEPFGALDAMTRESMQDELTHLWREVGCAVLFVTHDLEEAVHLADRVLMLGGSPAGVVGDYRIDAPRPRARGASLEQVAAIRSDLFRSVNQGEGI